MIHDNAQGKHRVNPWFAETAGEELLQTNGFKRDVCDKHSKNTYKIDRATKQSSSYRLHQLSHEMVQQYEDDDVQHAHDRVFEQGRSVPEQRLPPGMTEARFSEMIQTLKDIVGDDQVHTGESLLHFSDPFSPHTENFPSASIWCVKSRCSLKTYSKKLTTSSSPGSVEEIGKILALANGIHIPLWTVSRGKNLGSVIMFTSGKIFPKLTCHGYRYGGPSPRVGGSVILSLHRMNRVLEVNEKGTYAVVEPGVTFFDLYNYCRDRKLAVWPSAPAIAWGSVVGNVWPNESTVRSATRSQSVNMENPDSRPRVRIHRQRRPSSPYLWNGSDSPRWRYYSHRTMGGGQLTNCICMQSWIRPTNRRALSTKQSWYCHQAWDMGAAAARDYYVSMP